MSEFRYPQPANEYAFEDFCLERTGEREFASDARLPDRCDVVGTDRPQKIEEASSGSDQR